MMVGVDVEVLVVPGCPSGPAASRRLRAVLDAMGLAGVEVRTSVISTATEAFERGFLGSPTIMVDGVDLFDDPQREPAMACRLYRTPDGLAGLPPAQDLREALDSVRADVRH